MTEKQFLKSYNIENYERPSVSTDICTFSAMNDSNENLRKDSDKQLGILLIKRADYPFKDYWALPGGFMKKGEDAKDAALRELKEETGVRGAYLNYLGMFANPERDPRGWIVSNAFYALIEAGEYRIHASTDAREAKWFSLDFKEKKTSERQLANGYVKKYKYVLTLESDTDILSAELVNEVRYERFHCNQKLTIVQNNGLAFDHAMIITEAFLKLKEETLRDERVIFDLLPEKFTFNELQKTVEMITGESLIVPNFRRKIAHLLIPTDEMYDDAGHRPARYYTRNIKIF